MRTNGNSKLNAIWILLLFVLFRVNAPAQEKKHELELGLGIWNMNEIINTFSDIIISSIPNDVKMKDGNSFGSLHAGYKYRFTDRLGLGGLLAYDYSYDKGELSGVEVGKFYKNHYTLAFEADYNYVVSDKFKMYALAGLGGTLYTLRYKDFDDSRKNDSDATPYFTFQITPVGLKFGKNIGGFLEFGFGYRGIINAGAFIRL